MAGWLIPSALAAAVIVPCSTTARKRERAWRLGRSIISSLAHDRRYSNL
jgi:hypothetical protein